MLLYNARKKSQGFTLIEVLIILFIIGILSAIAAPSFLGRLNRSKVNNAVAQVKGALQEAQREAIRKSKNCTVIITVGSSATLTSPREDINNNGNLDLGEDINNNSKLDKNNCLITGNRTLSSSVALATDVTGSPIKIEFTFQGNAKLSTTNENGNIVLYESNSSNLKMKCVAISNGIGIIRSGDYTSSTNPPTSITETCTQKIIEL